jgi:hypothetical protein
MQQLLIWFHVNRLEINTEKTKAMYYPVPCIICIGTPFNDHSDCRIQVQILRIEFETHSSFWTSWYIINYERITSTVWSLFLPLDYWLHTNCTQVWSFLQQFSVLQNDNVTNFCVGSLKSPWHKIIIVLCVYCSFSIPQPCIAYWRGYVLRNALLGDFIIVQTS